MLPLSSPPQMLQGSFFRNSPSRLLFSLCTSVSRRIPWSHVVPWSCSLPPPTTSSSSPSADFALPSLPPLPSERFRQVDSGSRDGSSHAERCKGSSVGSRFEPSLPSIPGKFSKYSKPISTVHTESSKKRPERMDKKGLGCKPIGDVARKTDRNVVKHDESSFSSAGADADATSDKPVRKPCSKGPLPPEKLPDWIQQGSEFSYSEVPKAPTIGFRENPRSSFGASDMVERPLTGSAPLKPQKKKVPEFDSFNPPPPGKEGVTYVESPGPFPPGEGPKPAKTREEILGEPLTPLEINELVNAVNKSRKQLDLGSDGLTHNMLNVIHSHWKGSVVCKIKCVGVPTIDMDNLARVIEDKTGGIVIHRSGGALHLFRGRNYNYKDRPKIPITVWEPADPVYPQLIQPVPEGFRAEEAKRLLGLGRKVAPFCNLSKNGVYSTLVAEVRAQLEIDEVVKVDCRGMNPTDYKKIGAKLKDLVPCTLLSFEKEQVIVSRKNPALVEFQQSQEGEQAIDVSMDGSNSTVVEHIQQTQTSRNQLKEGVKLSNFYHDSTNVVQETEHHSCCDYADRDRAVHSTSEAVPKSRVLNEVLTVLNEISKTDDLSYKLAPFEGKISFRDGTTIMKLIDDKRLCFSFYMWLKQQDNFIPDLTSLLTVIRYLLLTNKWEKLILVTQDLFDSGFKLDNGTYCRIIKEASLSGNATVCDWWFQKMKERRCWPDQTTYNTMIHAYALARIPEKSFAIFDEMKEMGIEPDINTFCHLLNACQRTADPGTAHSVFLQMGNYGLTPDLVTYSILLDTYGKQGKITEAAALFKEMQETGVTPDAKAYNSLIHAYGKAGMMDQATITFNEYQKLAAQNPDKVIFWAMLHLYSKSGLLQQALAVKRAMRVAKIPVDASCYATLIDGFRRKERWEDASRAFKEMQRYKYPIGEGVYELMLRIYSEAGHHVECERIFDQMIAKGFRNRLDMYEIMINIYKRTNHITNATRIYEQMKRNKCTPNRNICNTMIHIYAKAGMLPACEKVAEEMGSAGIKPNKSTFLTLIKAYNSYGQYFSAMDMYEVMQETGIKPDYELSELIVEILLKTGQVQKAENFLKEIIAAGINPNKRMVSAVLRAGGVVELSKPLAISKTRSPD